MPRRVKMIPDNINLYGSYLQGYTTAIQDIIEVFEYIQDDLSYHHKRLNSKTVAKILKCCLENRAELLNSEDGFIRYNNGKQEFEFYEPKSQNKGGSK